MKKKAILRPATLTARRRRPIPHCKNAIFYLYDKKQENMTFVNIKYLVWC